MREMQADFRETIEEDKTYVCHIQRYNGAGVVTAAHVHDFVEIICGIDCDYMVYVDDEAYEFKSGDMMVFCSEKVHKIVSKRTGVSEHVCLRFNPYAIIETSKYIVPFMLNDKKNKCYFSAEQLRNSELSLFMSGLIKEIQQRKYGSEIAIKSYLVQICLFILRHWNPDDELGLNKVDEKRMFDVLLYIEENYRREISVAEMAERYFVSCGYFSNWFKKVMGKNFKQYVNQVRINHAIQLLLKSEHNITEVAMLSGFATTSYFIKQFKAYEGGCSPKQFRTKYKNTN